MKRKLKICTGPSCCRNHAQEIVKKAKKSAKVTDTEITETSCMGLCTYSPCINLDGKIITNVNPSEIGKIMGDASAKSETQTNPNLEDAQLDNIADLLNP